MKSAHSLSIGLVLAAGVLADASGVLVFSDDFNPATVPEPGSLALAGLALVLCASGFRRSIGAATV